MLPEISSRTTIRIGVGVLSNATIGCEFVVTNLERLALECRDEAACLIGDGHVHANELACGAKHGLPCAARRAGAQHQNKNCQRALTRERGAHRSFCPSTAGHGDQ
jgi:hypothetical protein